MHNIITLPAGSPGLPDCSLELLTGLGPVAMVQTSYQVEDTFVPHTIANMESAVHTDGTFVKKLAALQTISGGVLSELGPINAAEVICKGDSATLVVGGVKGLALLCAPDGSWWSASTGLGNKFSFLPDHMLFKKIGNYRFVRKLLYDNGMLYVLTDQQLDRIDLSTAAMTAVTIAHVKELFGNSPALLFDAVVSDKCALLATSEGLWRVGNNCSAYAAQSTSAMQWTRIPLPEGHACVRQLMTLSQTGRSQDVARGAGGMVYALNGYRGKGLSKVHRIIVSPTTDAAVSHETVQLFADAYINQDPSSFLNFGGYRTLFYTNGIMYTHVGLKDDGQAALYYTPYEHIVGRLQNKSVKTPSVEMLLKIDGKMVTGLQHCSGLGNRIIVGDFGMYMQQ